MSLQSNVSYKQHNTNLIQVPYYQVSIARQALMKMYTESPLIYSNTVDIYIIEAGEDMKHENTSAVKEQTMHNCIYMCSV